MPLAPKVVVTAQNSNFWIQNLNCKILFALLTSNIIYVKRLRVLVRCWHASGGLLLISDLSCRFAINASGFPRLAMPIMGQLGQFLLGGAWWVYLWCSGSVWGCQNATCGVWLWRNCTEPLSAADFSSFWPKMAPYNWLCSHVPLLNWLSG